MKKSVLAVLCGLLAVSLIRADDWPQFRGPDRTGVSTEKGLLKVWPKGGPALAWKFEKAGLGFSSVSVAKGFVYTLGTDEKFTDEYVIAIDEKTGKEKWRVKIGPLFTFDQNEWGDGPRSTPTVDGDLLFALGGQGDLVCVDVAKDGKEVWRKNMAKDFGGVMMTQWGYSESPLVDGELLLCTPGGANGTLAALDKKTGALKWRTKAWTDKAPYSSIVAADIHGVRQYIQAGFTGPADGGNLAGIDTKGNVLWKQSIFGGDSYEISPTPIVSGNLVYHTTNDSCHLFEINKMQQAKDLYPKKIQRKVKNRDGGVVLVDGHIYGHSETQSWICQDLKTGENSKPDGWREQNKFQCSSGSVVAADGMIYAYTDEGDVGLIEATPKNFNLISSFTIPEKSKIPANRKTSRSSKMWAHPVIANGVLYVRDHEYIFAFKIK